jgi:hypothetical protein
MPLPVSTGAPRDTAIPIAPRVKPAATPEERPDSTARLSSGGMRDNTLQASHVKGHVPTYGTLSALQTISKQLPPIGSNKRFGH